MSEWPLDDIKWGHLHRSRLKKSMVVPGVGTHNTKSPTITSVPFESSKRSPGTANMYCCEINFLKTFKISTIRHLV